MRPGQECWLIPSGWHRPSVSARSALALSGPHLPEKPGAGKCPFSSIRLLWPDHEGNWGSKRNRQISESGATRSHGGRGKSHL